MIQLFASPTQVSFLELLSITAPAILAWGWLLVLLLGLWLAWSTYRLLRMIDYVSAIQWTFLQVTIPEDAEQTPKAMEQAIKVWAGIHKNPDIVERYFQGYLEAWYSLELQCEYNRVRYMLVVPAVHRQFFEGVVYGQYPTAEIREVEDYTQRFRWQDIGKTFDMYGTEVILSNDDIYPIRTYIDYEDPLAPEDRFIDPHQSLVEAYTNVNPGEEYWVQVLVRPIDAGDVSAWTEKGEQEIARISGQAPEEAPGLLTQIKDFFFALPGELLKAASSGPLENGKEKDKPLLKFFNPSDEAKMKGVLQKISVEAYRTKIRLIYIAPTGQLNKPNISRAIGAFKQFNTYNLNGVKPDPETKTNGPNYLMKFKRRRYRERKILLLYQWRDFWGYGSGQMFTSEEIATLYHFPAKWVKAPMLERAKAGLQSAPENLPYA